MTDNIIRVGTGIIALNSKNQFLMGRRKNSHGEGTWALPGGKMEFGETIEQCAAREMLEETGLELSNIKVVTVANHFFDNKTKHFIALMCIGRISGEPKIMEPHKIGEWLFIDDWQHLPQPTFVPYHEEVPFELIENYIKSN